MDFLKQASQSLGGQGGDSNLLQEAEGFFGSQQNSSGQQSTTNTPAAGTQQAAAGKAPPPGDLAAAAAAPGSGASGNENYSQVYSSAETLYQGLSDKISGKQSNIDEQQLAGAAANVLEAADNTGFVKNSQYGDYFDKAESYLQKYGAPASGAPAGAANPGAQRTSGAANPGSQRTSGAYTE